MLISLLMNIVFCHSTFSRLKKERERDAISKKRFLNSEKSTLEKNVLQSI